MVGHYNARFVILPAQADLEAEIASIQPDTAIVPAAVAASQRIIRLTGLAAAPAILLKQELLAVGGDALLSAAVYFGERETTTDALIFASRRQLIELVARLRTVPLPALPALADELDELLRAEDAGRGVLAVGAARLAWGTRTYIMGIINVTPDSFSADGLAQPGADHVALAVAQARRQAEEGADLLDIGGESTRPGASPIDGEEELRRVVPAVAAIAGELPLPISVDTYRAEVAAAALDAGAQIINDIWGLRTPEGGWNQALAALVAARGVPIVLMHNRRAQAVVGALGGRYPSVVYRDLLGEIIGELRESIAYAESQGIPREHIIVDPGLGFGKTPEQNLVVMRRMAELHNLGQPFLVGASRKSFIGLPLNLPVQERDEGTAATTALAVSAGADIVRVHNVKMNVRAARIADAIIRP